LICAGAPAETEPMSRLAMRASISSGLSLGTIDINAWPASPRRRWCGWQAADDAVDRCRQRLLLHLLLGLDQVVAQADRLALGLGQLAARRRRYSAMAWRAARSRRRSPPWPRRTSCAAR